MLIAEPDPVWALDAARAIGALREAVSPFALVAAEHIGSTAVPGLAAKPFIDLQLTFDALPDADAFTAAVVPLGLKREHGARADSPGVTHDIPRPGADPNPALYRKQLYTGTLAGREVIVHVRLAASPFAEFVVAFRDYLRAHPVQARAYEAEKRLLAAQQQGSADYDDYTRAKTSFIDAVQVLMTGAVNNGTTQPDGQDGSVVRKS